MTPKELEIRINDYYDQWKVRVVIKQIKELECQLRDLYDTGGSMKMDGMPHSTTPGNAPLEAVCAAEDKAESIRWDIVARRHEFRVMKRKIRATERAINQLESSEQHIIYLRHCEGKNFKQIGQISHYSESRAKHKYGEALRKLMDMFEKAALNSTI